MTGRVCLACEEPLSGDPRRKTCSGRCRQRIHAAGGAAAAAAIFSSWAASWAAAGAEDQAAKLKARAERCRQAAERAG